MKKKLKYRNRIICVFFLKKVKRPKCIFLEIFSAPPLFGAIFISVLILSISLLLKKSKAIDFKL
jgi:hypothetical protein